MEGDARGCAPRGGARRGPFRDAGIPGADRSASAPPTIRPAVNPRAPDPATPARSAGPAWGGSDRRGSPPRCRVGGSRQEFASPCGNVGTRARRSRRHGGGVPTTRAAAGEAAQREQGRSRALGSAPGCRRVRSAPDAPPCQGAREPAEHPPRPRTRGFRAKRRRRSRAGSRPRRGPPPHRRAAEAEETHGGEAFAHVYPVEHQRVEVDVRIQGVAGALHEGHGAALAASDAPLRSS